MVPTPLYRSNETTEMLEGRLREGFVRIRQLMVRPLLWLIYGLSTNNFRP